MATVGGGAVLVGERGVGYAQPEAPDKQKRSLTEFRCVTLVWKKRPTGKVKRAHGPLSLRPTPSADRMGVGGRVPFVEIMFSTDTYCAEAHTHTHTHTAEPPRLKGHPHTAKG